jgi:hypothetical protein
LEAALHRQIGDGPAATLMALLPPFDWTEVARQPDLVAVKADVAELKTDVAGLKDGMGQLRGDMALLRGEFVEFRGLVRNDLAAMQLQSVAMWSRQIFITFGAMIGLAGLVLAAVRV